MGMAASQARLLCITARIHDVEHQAQSIQNAKMHLATLSDRAYQEYNEALEATTLTISALDGSGAKSTVTANFNTLCSRNRVLPSNGATYALRNTEGLLVVEDDIMEAYLDFRDSNMDDPYQFAMLMINNGNVNHIGNIDNGEYEEAMLNAEEGVYQQLLANEEEGEKGTKTASDKLKNLHEQLEKYTGEGENIYDYQAVASEDRDAYEETLAAYRHELYKTNGAEIHAKAGEDEELIEEFDSSEFNYYVNIYNQIKSCGGCVSINDYNGLNGDAANDSDWLQSMIQSGQFTIEIVETDTKTGDVDFSATSPSSDSCLSYTETTSIDKKELAKAEAKYENALRDIDKKDKEYDLSLSKLETERTALTTEYESVKKVITDNIDRTFGIFS